MRATFSHVFLLFGAASCGSASSGTAAVPSTERRSAPATVHELMYSTVLDTVIGPGALAIVPESTSSNWHTEGLVATAPFGFESASAALATAPTVLPMLPGVSYRMVRVSRETFGALAHATPLGVQKRFGRNAVLMRLSAVGVSADTTHAVVAADTWLLSGSVQSELLYLLRSSEGRWSVSERIPVYIEQ